MGTVKETHERIAMKPDFIFYVGKKKAVTLKSNGKLVVHKKVRSRHPALPIPATAHRQGGTSVKIAELKKQAEALFREIEVAADEDREWNSHRGNGTNAVEAYNAALDFMDLIRKVEP